MPCDFAVQSAAMEKNILPAGRPPSPADKRLPGLAGSPQQGLVRAGARAGPEKTRSAFSIRIYAKILILSDSLSIKSIRVSTRLYLAFWRLTGGNGTRFHRSDHGEDHVKSPGFEHELIPCERKPVSDRRRPKKIPAPSLPLAHWRCLHHILE
jgi:hypothetical protein